MGCFSLSLSSEEKLSLPCFSLIFCCTYTQQEGFLEENRVGGFGGGGPDLKQIFALRRARDPIHFAGERGVGSCNIPFLEPLGGG